MLGQEIHKKLGRDTFEEIDLFSAADFYSQLHPNKCCSELQTANVVGSASPGGKEQRKVEQ